MGKITFGLLPFYLELYDDVAPERRQHIQDFYDTIADEFQQRGLQPLTAKICRVADEFEEAIRHFEAAGACAIVTLHLAYSPSLESAEILADTHLPLLVLDTTPSYDFGPEQDPDMIMHNHGIHGVQDMCNILVRNNIEFGLEAGHWKSSDVIDRACAHLVGCSMAAKFKNTRTGMVGESFKGMGDFAIPEPKLREMTGHSPVHLTAEKIEAYVDTITDDEIKAQMLIDLDEMAALDVDEESHRLSTLAGLILGRWLCEEKIDAFSINFLNITKKLGMPVMPFLEISKSMARTIGYAGEGDLLTASLISAIASFYAQTTFTEMFCPDWKGNRIFLSHMGEVNLDLLVGKPGLITKPFPYTDAGDPVVGVGRLKPGHAVFVNLAPVSGDEFNLIIAPGRMHDAEEDRFGETVHGWFEPRCPVSDFLTLYSSYGGTHHAALVYDGSVHLLATFASYMGWNPQIIGGDDMIE